MPAKKVIITRGPSGSGKDTFLRSLAKHLGHSVPVVSADDHFVQENGEYAFDVTKLADAHEDCFRRFMMQCEEDHDAVAVSNTSMQLFEVAPYIMFARAKGIDISIYEISVPGATFGDYAEFNIHDVPMESVARMEGSFEAIPPFWPNPVHVYSKRDDKEFLVGVDVDGKAFDFKVPADLG